jgi:hypothetical protein
MRNRRRRIPSVKALVRAGVVGAGELNLRPLPCQQTGGKRCADRRFPRSPPTVDAEVMRSLGDLFFRRLVPMVSVAPSMRVRGWGLGPRLGRGPVKGRVGMQRRGSRRPARCLGDNCQSSVLYGPVGSGQVRLGGVSGESGLVGSVVACGMTVRMTAALAIDPKPPPAEVATGSIVLDRDYGYERRTTMALATNSSSRGHGVPTPTTRWRRRARR